MCEIELLDYQEKIVSDIKDSLADCHQAALKLFTSGGKSFIAASIVKEYLDNDSDSLIAWFGPLSPINNVRSKIFSTWDKDSKSRIVFINYESMSHGNLDINSEDLSRVTFAVFDECHRALAEQTSETLEKYQGLLINSDILAMSATPNRTDGIHSFNKIVPLAKVLDYGMQWGANRSVINELKYFACATKLNKLDFTLLEMYENYACIYPALAEKCKAIKEAMLRYTWNMTSGVYNTLKSSGMDTSCTNGDRHIVFFSTVGNIATYKKAVADAFAILYPNAKINTYEFHSKSSKANNSFVLDNIINGRPTSNNVDLIFTVNKGGESIHPIGTKSILMFRKTYSPLVFNQQIGRVITLSSMDSSTGYIFDFMENCMSLLNKGSIEYGTFSADKRLKTLMDKVATLDDIAENIQNYFGGNIRVVSQFATDELREIYESINSLYDTQVISYNISQIMAAIEFVDKHNKSSAFNFCPTLNNLAKDLEATHNMTGRNPRFLSLYQGSIVRIACPDTIHGEFSNRLIRWIRAFRMNMLNGRYKNDDAVNNFIKKLGHTLFFSSAMGGMHSNDDEKLLKSIDKVYRSMRRNNSEVGGAEASGELAKLRMAKIAGQIPPPVCAYARFWGVDLDVIEDNSIEEIADKTHRKRILSVYKDLNAELSGILAENPNDAERKAIKVLATILTKFDDSDPVHNRLKADLIDKYKSLLRKYKITREEAYNISIIRGIMNLYTGGTGEISGVYEDFLFVHYGNTGLTKIEKAVAKAVGLSMKKKYDSVIERTWAYRVYRSAIEQDKTAIKYVSSFFNKPDSIRRGYAEEIRNLGYC